MTIYNPPSVIKEIQFPGTLSLANPGNKAQVKRLQEWLNFHEFGTQVDGVFGPATDESLKDFQTHNTINRTGVLDQSTWDALIRPMVQAMTQPAGPANNYGAAVEAIAKQHLAVHPIELGGENRGPWVRAYMLGHDGSEYLWCAGFVSFVLAQAANLCGSHSPLQYTFSCDNMVEDAQHSGQFLGTAHNRSTPLIFAKRRTPSDWFHVGFCFSWNNNTVFKTIEGNADSQGSSNGFEVASLRRNAASGDYDFISL